MPALDTLQTDVFRLPDYKVFVYDIISTRGDDIPETMHLLVQGGTITAPFDFTEFVSAVVFSEVATDFVQGSLTGNSITFSLVDKALRFDPQGGTDSRWLKSGNLVRVHEGDSRSTLILNETFNGSSTTVGGTVQLVGRDVVRREDVIVRETTVDGTLLTLGVDYTIDEFNGTITGLGTKWVTATDYFVTYTARQIPVQDWPITFTGTLVGRPGAAERDRSENQFLQLQAADRLISFTRAPTTSQPFPQGTLFQDMMISIMENEADMSFAEFDFGSSGTGEITTQATTQFVDEPPLLSVAKIAFVDGFFPRFRGNGILEMTNNLSSKGADIIYENEDLFSGFTRPFNPLEHINEIEVLGLNSTLVKIEQPKQVLATASLTLGFFGGDAEINVQYSDDKTQQVDGPTLRLIQSVTGALIPFGAEEFTPKFDDDGGSREGEIAVEGAFYAPLVVSLYGARIIASFIPDGAALFETIPIGRLVEGIISTLTSLIQATIGRGDYQIVGIPYEYVFEEIRRVARVANLAREDIRSLTIENHLLDNDVGDEVQAVANRELQNVRRRANTWQSSMRHDLRLEPGDKFILPDNREFIVTQIQRTLSREPSAKVADLNIYETTPGVWP